MKKLSSLIFTLIFVITLSACKITTQTENNESETFISNSSASQSVDSTPSDTESNDDLTSSLPDESTPSDTDVPSDNDTTESDIDTPTTSTPETSETPDVCADGHNFSEKRTESTCAVKGSIKKTCSDCGKTETVSLPLKEHSHTTSYKTLNSSQHQVVYTCTVCKDSYSQNQNHSWGNWSTTKNPTTTTLGEKERKCNLCGQTETNTIPKLETPPQEKLQRILDLVNAERQKAGVAALQYYNAGQSLADIRADEIATYFSHTRPNGESCFSVLDDAGIHYWAAGENIALGQLSPEEVMEDWMNSPGHRENILNQNYTHLIVGYRADANAWVQLFIKL